METLFEILNSLRDNGERTAVLAFGPGDVERWSYKRLADSVAAVTASLLERGVGPGDRVAISAAPSPAFIAAALGVIGAGAAVVPTDLQLNGAALSAALELADVRLV